MDMLLITSSEDINLVCDSDHHLLQSASYRTCIVCIYTKQFWRQKLCCCRSGYVGDFAVMLAGYQLWTIQATTKNTDCTTL